MSRQTKKGIFSQGAELLSAVRNRFPDLGRRMEEAQAVEHWEGAVGPQIARHARIIRVQAGILFVEVGHPLWRSGLHFRKKQILEKVNLSEKELITDIVFLLPQSGTQDSDDESQKQKGYGYQKPSNSFKKRGAFNPRKTR